MDDISTASPNNLPTSDIYSPYAVDLNLLAPDSPDWTSYLAKISSLPEKIRGILFDSETVEFFLNLAEAEDLTDGQSVELSRLVKDILVGDLFIGDMAQMIFDRLHVPPVNAKEISSKIISELFAPALEDIKVMQREKFAGRVTQQASTQAPQPAAPPPVPGEARPKDLGGNTLDLRNKW